jgi:Ca2+-transporting ATPase
MLLLPVHIAFMELVFNPTCSLVFEAEPATKDLMREPPVPITEALITVRGLLHALLIGGLIGTGLMLFNVWLMADGANIGQVRAAVFTAMVSANLGAIVLYRREHLLARFSVIGWWTLLLALCSLLVVVCVPPIATLFAFEALSLYRWAMTVIGAFLLVAVYRIIRPNL